ncbi:YgcG family protein [Variovorax sp. E3]|uniref:TPM domain-containing protein n=1 Tax=Variovorax sp. E3 TaxID=1914993 RepID=UPI0018DD6A63|nr:TPM domain-containing protein [Variovorax sp. E3]
MESRSRPLAARAWLCLFMTMALAWALCLPAQAKPVPVPAMASRVVDLTKTLDASDASALRQDIAEIEQSTQAQLAVLIVPTTGEDSIEQFATRVFAQWKLGRRDEDDGVLLLVALKDRRMRIEVGTGLEGRITDIQAARIIDGEMTPRFRGGDFAGGVKAAVASLSALISAPAAQGVQVIEEEPPQEEHEPSLLRRAVDTFSADSSQSRTNLGILGVMLWTIGVGAWHGTRPRQPSGPRVVAHGTGKRGRKSRRQSERDAQREAALWADLKTEGPPPKRRYWPTVLLLLATGPVARWWRCGISRCCSWSSARSGSCTRSATCRAGSGRRATCSSASRWPSRRSWAWGSTWAPTRCRGSSWACSSPASSASALRRSWSVCACIGSTA